MTLTGQLEKPIRYPDTRSAALMTKRARWLVVLGFILPGSAQILTGKRKLGRLGLAATICMLLFFVAAFVLYIANRSMLLTIFTKAWVLLALQIIVIAYAVLWLILGFDTLRLTKLGKTKPNWRLPIAAISIVLTLLPVLGAAWLANTIGAGRSLISEVFVSNKASVEPVDGRYNILLLGVDSGADREGLRPDSVSLISVDAQTGQSIIVGLPREMANMQFPESSPMYAEHPAGFGVTSGCYTGRCWLNSLYAEVQYFQPELYPEAEANGSEPGIEATKDAVSGSTGLTVQFYVMINMDGFEQIIDALGGVTINVTEEVPIGGDSEGYGIEGYIQPGEQKLNGYEALWYARSRYGSARGDYDRMERQRELQSAILKQMNPQNVLLRFQEISASGAAVAETDIPSSMLGYFVDLAAKAATYDPVRVELSPPAIITEDPDFDEVRRMVAEAVAQASPTEE